MLASPREMLRRNLSPQTYNRLRYSWWLAGKSYLPRLVASSLRRLTPRIRSFPDRGGSSPLQRLRAVNVLAPTQLCRIMTWYGSDKGSMTWYGHYKTMGYHNYTTVYSALFADIRTQPLRIFELGLGTNNPAVPSNMSAYGRPGASLRGWRDFFSRARVYGADIDRDILFEEDRIRTFHCDQCDPASIRRLWSEPELQGSGMDIIIEDGLHSFEANVSFLEGSLQHLRPGGFYVVEDIHRTTLARWAELLGTDYTARFQGYEFALVDVPNLHNPDSNNLLLVHRYA
jgi:hypothetical protein